MQALQSRPAELIKNASQRQKSTDDLIKKAKHYQKLDQQLKLKLEHIKLNVKNAELQKFGQAVDLDRIVAHSKNKPMEELKSEFIDSQKQYQIAIECTNVQRADQENELVEVLAQQTELINSLNEAKSKELLDNKTIAESVKNEADNVYLTERLRQSNIDLEKLKKQIRDQETMLQRIACKIKLLSRKDSNLCQVSNS